MRKELACLVLFLALALPLDVPSAALAQHPEAYAPPQQKRNPRRRAYHAANYTYGSPKKISAAQTMPSGQPVVPIAGEPVVPDAAQPVLPLSGEQPKLKWRAEPKTPAKSDRPAAAPQTP